jgi:hypothetical protein
MKITMEFTGADSIGADFTVGLLTIAGTGATGLEKLGQAVNDEWQKWSDRQDLHTTPRLDPGGNAARNAGLASPNAATR